MGYPARHNTFKFYFGCTLATIVALSVILGSVYAVWTGFAPEEFFERVVTSIVCMGVFGVMGIVAFFVWLGIASQFE